MHLPRVPQALLFKQAFKTEKLKIKKKS